VVVASGHGTGRARADARAVDLRHRLRQFHRAGYWTHDRLPGLHPVPVPCRRTGNRGSDAAGRDPPSPGPVGLVSGGTGHRPGSCASVLGDRRHCRAASWSA
jgi:hypothetical protein